MFFLHTIACLTIVLLLGTATETDTAASSNGSATKQGFITYIMAVQKWKKCSFPDPFLYESPPGSSDPRPMLERCRTEEESLDDKQTEDKLFGFLLCQQFYSLSLLICQDGFQEFRNKCLNKEAFTNIKPFDDVSDVCTALPKYPSGYNNFTSLFSSPHCKENCGESVNSMKGICELYGTVLYQHMKKCPNPQDSTKNGEASSEGAKGKETSDAPSALSTPKEAIIETPAHPADISSGTGTKEPTKMETVKPGLVPPVPESVSMAGSSIVSAVPGSVTNNASTTPKPESEPKNDNNTPNPATPAQPTKGPEPQHFQPAKDNKDGHPTGKTDEDGISDGTNNEGANDEDSLPGADDDDNDGDDEPPNNKKISLDKSPSDSINEGIESKDKPISNTENNKHDSPSDTGNDIDTSQEENENAKASKEAKQQPKIDNDSNKPKANEKNHKQDENEEGSAEEAKQQTEIDNGELDKDKNEKKPKATEKNKQGKEKNEKAGAEILDKDAADASNALNDPDLEESPGSGHFLAYFLAAVVICITGYVIYHNKQKIMAFIIEGRNSGRGGRQRSKDVKYSQLKSNVEEVLPSLEQTATSKNFIY